MSANQYGGPNNRRGQYIDERLAKLGKDNEHLQARNDAQAQTIGGQTSLIERLQASLRRYEANCACGSDFDAAI